MYYNWKGTKGGYKNLHKWVKRNKGNPPACQKCKEDKKRRVWANKSGRYLKNLKDWIPLCYSCHWKYDKQSWWLDHLKGKVPWNKGKQHSEQTKEKIRQKALGRNHSIESRKKMIGRIPPNKGIHKRSKIGCTICSNIYLPMRDSSRVCSRKCYYVWQRGKPKIREHIKEYSQDII